MSGKDIADAFFKISKKVLFWGFVFVVTICVVVIAYLKYQQYEKYESHWRHVEQIEVYWLPKKDADLEKIGLDPRFKGIEENKELKLHTVERMYMTTKFYDANKNNFCFHVANNSDKTIQNITVYFDIFEVNDTKQLGSASNQVEYTKFMKPSGGVYLCTEAEDKDFKKLIATSGLVAIPRIGGVEFLKESNEK